MPRRDYSAELRGSIMNFLKESKGDVVNQVLQITFEAISLRPLL